MNFELDGLNYQFEIFISERSVSYIDIVSKNACCADVYYTYKVGMNMAKHIDNAVKNGRIKLQYEDNDCMCVKCYYEYETDEGLKKDTFRLLATCAGPKQLIKKQKTYNALVEENAALKAKLL